MREMFRDMHEVLYLKMRGVIYVAIYQIRYNAKEEDGPFLEALWEDVQRCAYLLGIREFIWEIIEENISPRRATNFHVRYEVSSKKRLDEGGLWMEAQAYEALNGEDGYHGRVRIAFHIGSRLPELKRGAFFDLCFAAYYRKIHEFFPEYTTKYIDAPKGV